MNIWIEDSRAGGPVTDEFINLLLYAASEAMNRRKPNPQALRVAKVIASENLDWLNSDDLEQIFKDAELYFQRITVDLTDPN